MTLSNDDATGKLWPTTRGAVNLIDGLHSATGLPWWATLSLTALGAHSTHCKLCTILRTDKAYYVEGTSMVQKCSMSPAHAVKPFYSAWPPSATHGQTGLQSFGACAGVRAALLPFTLNQMRASTALMAEWRLANHRAAMRHAQTGASQARSMEAPSAASAPVSKSPFNSTASKGGFQAAAATAPPPPHEGRSSAAASSHSQAAGVEDIAQMRCRPLGHPESESWARAPESGNLDKGDGPQPEEGSSSGRDRGQPQRGRQSLRSIWEEYRRIREGSRAPRALWLIGSPLVQVRPARCAASEACFHADTCFRCRDRFHMRGQCSAAKTLLMLGGWAGQCRLP